MRKPGSDLGSRAQCSYGRIEWILTTLLMNSTGVRTGWRVIQGRPDFFSITALVNALQRRAAVILQKSLREGLWAHSRPGHVERSRGHRAMSEASGTRSRMA